jgi:hypothetical protein
MATLQIRKETNKVWRHVPSDALPYIVSKLYIKSDGDLIRVVEQGGSQRGQYNFTDVSVYNIGGGAETFGSAQQLMERLEALNYIGFFYEGEVSPSELISSDVDNAIELGTDGKLFAPISGGGGAVDSVNGQTGVVVLDADDVSDATTTNKFVTTTEKNTWNNKLDKSSTPSSVYATDEDGEQVMKPLSEIGEDTFTLTFHTGSKTWVLDTWYQQFSSAGFNISGTTTYGTGSVPTSTVHLNGSWLQIPSGFIIDKVTFGVQSIGSALSGTAYRNEVYITRGEVTAEQTANTQTSLEVLCQQNVDFTGDASNPKFLKDLTIASHTAKSLSILQVVMREKLVNNAAYNALLQITFKKA